MRRCRFDVPRDAPSRRGRSQDIAACRPAVCAAGPDQSAAVRRPLRPHRPRTGFQRHARLKQSLDGDARRAKLGDNDGAARVERAGPT